MSGSRIPQGANANGQGSAGSVESLIAEIERRRRMSERSGGVDSMEGDIVFLEAYGEARRVSVGARSENCEIGRAHV